MAHLITVAGSKIPLQGGQSYLFGRGRRCDVVVDDSACSRKHARIALSHRGDLAYLEDLHSRNGSFVNGERVGGRAPLEDGSRIRLGATVFLVRLREESEDELTDTGTTAFEEAGLGAEIQGGELSAYGALDLLKLLLHGHSDLTLHVALPDGAARVELRGGEIVAALCGGLDGFNALVKLGRAGAGIFWVTESSEPVERNVKQPTSHLLAELARCIGVHAPA
jgi:hypothetical protein